MINQNSNNVHFSTLLTTSSKSSTIFEHIVPSLIFVFFLLVKLLKVFTYRQSAWMFCIEGAEHC